MARAHLVVAVTAAVCLQIGLRSAPAVGQEKPAKVAQVAQEGYQAQVRLRFDASPDQRVHLFRAAVKRLESLGFKKDKGLEGEEFYGDTVSGVVPVTNARRLVEVKHVQTVLLTPAGQALPTEADKPVLTELTLAGLFSGTRQQDLFDKARTQLSAIGFREAVGYDHRAFTRVLGWFPAGRLNALLKGEVQIEASLAGAQATRALSPFRIITAIPEPEGTEPAKEPAAPAPVPREQAFREKISADLRGLIAGLGEDKQKQPLRVELVLRSQPDRDDPLGFLRQYVVVEGKLGPLVTGLIHPVELDALASLPEVSTVRLPQPARSQVLPPEGKAAALPLDFIEIRREFIEKGSLAELVRKQKPQRSAVVAADFRGYQTRIGKGLPAKTRLIDLTAERRPDLQPEATAAGEGLGAGVRLALALHEAAPAEELYLVRIAPEAAYQLEDLARAVAGRAWHTESIRRRELELARERVRLEEERVDLRIERRILSSNFGNDPDSEAARNEYLKRQQRFQQDLKAYQGRSDAYLDLMRSIRQLKGVGTVLVGLSWLDGHANLPGEPASLRALDQDLLAAANWLFAAPRLPGQEWTGLFQDKNNDGVMEFEADSSGSTQVKFLAWRPSPWASVEQPVLELPAGTVAQVTVQWREVHAPAWKQQDEEDSYRRPIVPLQLVVLRQRDPAGEKVPADVFDVVARSTELPDRLENTPRYAIYQSTLRFQVPNQPGRYAIRLEGRTPQSTLPADAPQLPGAEKWELHPKLRVEAIDPASRTRGQVIFR